MGTAVADNMMVQTVDDRDVPIGVGRRSELFRKRQNFRTVHELIFDSHGRLLIQQLSSNRARHAEYWGSSVAGYIFLGESYLAAAYRRLSEELGVRDVPLRYVGNTTMSDEGCQKFIAVFSAVYDGPFKYDSEHVKTIEFAPISLIRDQKASGSRKFTPTFIQVLNFFECRI
jgi:isopentenyldiphosphate isomerase